MFFASTTLFPSSVAKVTVRLTVNIVKLVIASKQIKSKMVHPTNTNKSIDSGQTNQSNGMETSSTSSTQFDPRNLRENQQRNEDLTN